MKKIIFTLGLIAVSIGVFAQDGGSPMNKAVNKVTHSNDFLMVQLSYDGWAGAPDSIKSGLNRGFNIALMYDFPFKKSKLSMAAGLGISTSGVYLKDHTMDIQGKLNRNQVSFPTSTAKKNKVATTYLEIPIELRYRSVPDNANKGFKAAVGVKVGALVDAHTKIKYTGANGSKDIDKDANRGFFNPWRFAATARVGYGNFALFGSYSLNPLLKDNASNNLDIRPYQIGICLSGL
ncbi:Outer membrane protein beta-barrel domain-containing protein [Chitinophaga ginsengisegetis]|uniref:Outer membrane protein beta-barrel domain-containing protein n=1 Tax=Chitinophaga ginsengisegetis TaxID=393003 RepID=A0A1T5P741_9BACT|nr:porin family protein [Chitinophaga ginsengisegetis]SKD08522.1 Outer membrane protein beta-barrel domain-containing protein [Chitinophaga ginsengisegetis]